MMQGGKRAVSVWHRRAGKDSTALNLTAASAMMRPGVYWHMLPTVVQGRKVVWNGVDYHGRRIIDQVFPQEIRKRTNNNEMFIELINGSMWQVCGSDNYNSLVGSNPVGVIFSEWSLADPAAWNFIRPILLENGGWAMFIYTPRGKNHGYKTFDMAQGNDKWHAELLDVEHTSREDGTPVMSADMLEEEKLSGMPEDIFEQEYYCSFDAGMAGAFYTEELNRGYEDKRIGEHPWNPEKQCVSVWDLGIQDATAIGIVQLDGNKRPVVIDYIEDRNKGLDYYIKRLNETPYTFAGHFGPHDIENRDWVTGRTRREIADSLGLYFEVTPKLSIEDGIQSCRQFLNLCYINDKKCDKMLDGLASYRREFNEKMDIYTDRPVHDWSSHPSDMMRYMAIDWLEIKQMLSRNADGNKVRVLRAHR
jgi:phage terminase large subunit